MVTLFYIIKYLLKKKIGNLILELNLQIEFYFIVKYDGLYGIDYKNDLLIAV